MFTHGQLVRLKTDPSETFVVVGLLTEEFDAGRREWTFRIRRSTIYGGDVELVRSEHEIEAVEPQGDKPAAKTVEKCSYCQSAEPCFDGRTMAGLPCQFGKAETITLESGQTAAVQATIPADPFAGLRASDSHARIRAEIERAKNAPEQTPELLMRAENERLFAEGIPHPDDALPKLSDMRGMLARKPLEWHTDEADMTQSLCGHYTVRFERHSPIAGWFAGFFEDVSEMTPVIESDKPGFATREEAKAWCARHHAGEELEPRRCERCGLPVESGIVVCAECVLATSNLSQPVAVPMDHTEPRF